MGSSPAASTAIWACLTAKSRRPSRTIARLCARRGASLVLDISPLLIAPYARAIHSASYRLDACTNFELSSYADVLAQRINDADGASHNGGAGRAGPAALPSASGSDCAAASLSQPRLPGPAVTVEPSAEAVHAVQALFARQPEMVLDAAEPSHLPSVPEPTAAAPSAGAPHKRPRRECSTPVLLGLVDNFGGSLAATPAAAAAGPDAAAVPMTPQLQRRTSAPY